MNRAFQPTAEAVGAARAVVAAFAAAGGAGVVAHGGRMLDRPHLLRAQRVLALAAAVDAPARQRQRALEAESHGGSHGDLKKVDHITYACARGTIEKWAWFHIEVEGGALINRIDDVRPEDPDSSMKIWCIDYGEFGIALIEGIDRRKTVAGDALRRAQRRSFVPARRLRLPRSRRAFARTCSQRLPSARRKLSSATTASAS